MIAGLIPLLFVLAAAAESAPARPHPAYCDRLLDTANTVIGLSQANDERLAQLQATLNTGVFDSATFIVKRRMINAMSAAGAALQKNAGSANVKIQQLHDLAASPTTDADKRAPIENLARALEATLSRQARIGNDIIRATVIYEGRNGELTVGFGAGRSRLQTTGAASVFPNAQPAGLGPASSVGLGDSAAADDPSFTALPQIYPDWKDGVIANQNASFEKTMRQIGDEFAGRIQLVNAFEGLAAGYGDRASERCVEEPPAKLQQRADPPR